MASLGNVSIQLNLDVSKFKTALAGITPSLQNQVGSAEKSAVTGLGNAGKLGGQAFGSGVANSLGAISPALLKPLQGGGISSAFENAGKDAGRNFSAGLVDSIGGAVGKVKNLGTQIGTSLRESLKGVGQGIGQGIGQSIAQGLLSGVGNIGGAIAGTKNIGNYDASVRQIKTLGVNYSEFEATAKKVTKALGDSSDIVTTLNSLYDVASSGFTKAADAQQILTASTKLAVTSNSELADVQGTILGTLNAYGMAAGKATEVSNKLFGAINAGRMDGKDLASNFGNVVGAAAAAGVSLDETLSLLAVATLKTIKVPEAVTGLRALIDQFSNLSDAGKKALNDLGVRADSTIVKQRGVYAILKEIEAKGATSEQTAAIFSSSEARKIVTAVKGKPSASMYETSGKAISTTNIDGSFKDVSEGIIKRTEAAKNKLINLDVEMKKGAFGASILSALGALNKGIDLFAKSLSSLNEKYQTLNPQQQDFVKTIGGGIVILTGVVAAIGAVGIAIGLIGAPLKTATALAWGLGKGIGSITIASAPVVVPILAFGAALGLLAKAFGASDSDAIKTALVGVAIGVAALFGKAAIASVVSGGIAIATSLGGIAIAATAAIVPLAPFIAAGAAIAAGLFLLYKVFERFKPEIMAFTATLGRALSGAMNDIPGTFNKVLGFLGGFFPKSINMAIGWGTGIGNSVRNWTGTTANAIGKWISGLTGGLGGLRDFIGKAFQQSVKFGESLRDGFLRTFDPIIAKIKEAIEWIGSLVTKAGEAAAAMNPFSSSGDSATTSTGGVTVNASTYRPGGGGMNGKLIDARGRRLTPGDMAAAIPGLGRKDGIPYGTEIRVTNPRTGLATNATVRDTGPLAPGRELDITTAVSRAIGFNGREPLKVEIIKLPPGADPNKQYTFGKSTNFNTKNDNWVKSVVASTMISMGGTPIGGIMGAAQSAWNYGRSLVSGGNNGKNGQSLFPSQSIENLLDFKPLPHEGFYARRDGGRRQHNAIDFPAKAGTPVVSSFSGDATIIDYRRKGRETYGLAVRVRFTDEKGRKIQVTDGHLDPDSVFKATGKGINSTFPIKAGQQIGNVGALGARLNSQGIRDHIDRKVVVGNTPVDAQVFMRDFLAGKYKPRNDQSSPTPKSSTIPVVTSKPLPRLASIPTTVSTPAQNRLDDANAALQEAEAKYSKLQNQINPDKEAIEAAKKKRDRLRVVLNRILQAQNAKKKQLQDRQRLTPQSVVNAVQIADTDSAAQRRIDDASRGLAEAQTALTKLQNQVNPASADQIQAAKNRVTKQKQSLDRAIADAKKKNAEAKKKTEKLQAKTAQQQAEDDINLIGNQISIIDSDARLAASKIDGNTDTGKAQLTKIQASRVARQRSLLPRINALRAKYAKQKDLIVRLNDFESGINEIAKPDKAKEAKTLADVELLEQQIRQIDAARLSKDSLTDLAVSRRQVTAETGTIAKSTRLVDAAKRLASLLPQINNLKAKYADNPEIRSKIDEIENVIITRQRESADAQNSLNSGRLTKVKTKIEGLISENDRQTGIINNNVLSGGTDQLAADQAILSNKIALNAELQKEANLLQEIRDTTTNAEDRKSAIESLDQLARYNAETIAALRGDASADVTAQVEAFKQTAERIIRVGEQRQTDASQNLINNPESTTTEQTAANILVIRQQTAKQLADLIPLLEQYRSTQTDNGVIEALNEQLAKYRQITTETKAATDEAKKAAYETSILGQTSKSLTDTLGSGLEDVFRDAFRGFSSLGNILDGLINKIADIGINALLGNLGGGGGLLKSIGSIFGFKDGGTIRNYTTGGPIAGALNLASAYSKAMRKEGAGAVPLVGKVGEEMLSIPNARIYRAMVKDGQWAQMQKIYNYSSGGTIGAVQSVATRSTRGMDHRVIVDRINSVDYVSLDQVQAMFETQMPIAARAGAALTEQSFSNTSYRQRNGLK